MWGGWNADWREVGRASEERGRDYRPPPPFVGLEHLELCSENLRAWSRRTGHALSSQAPRVIETLPVELQLKFKTVRATLENDHGIDNLIAHLCVLNGERPGDRDRVAHSQALFDYMIRRGESLTDY
eukprot:6882879-Pyramimonas_sp.AAC.1